MTRARPMSKAERAALGDAIRHMIAEGERFHTVRHATGIALPKMPRDVYLPKGLSKRFHKGARS